MHQYQKFNFHSLFTSNSLFTYRSTETSQPWFLNSWKLDEFSKSKITSRYSIVYITLNELEWVDDYPPICDTYSYFYDPATSECKRNNIFKN